MGNSIQSRFFFFSTLYCFYRACTRYSCFEPFESVYVPPRVVSDGSLLSKKGRARHVIPLLGTFLHKVVRQRAKEQFAFE